MSSNSVGSVKRIDEVLNESFNTAYENINSALAARRDNPLSPSAAVDFQFALLNASNTFNARSGYSGMNFTLQKKILESIN
ncbi:hypothetical protein [Pantoea sp. A4]|uniref:hypothetical protein n=1 Tax=Pantoea sp. A4 TaxID=1225184 RepID=UPI000A49EA2B|nr:hypothetical protein [Pantoea sp. A4]